MLRLAAILLAVAALCGMGLLALYQWVRPVGRWRLPGIGHGLLGFAGFCALVAGLGGPPRGEAAGAGSFGLFAAVLVGAAILAAGLAWLVRRRAHAAGPLILGLHATLAMAGLTLLAAYLSYPGS